MAEIEHARIDEHFWTELRNDHLRILSVIVTNQDKITFSFGRNWQHYLEGLSEEKLQSAIKDITAWMKQEVLSKL